VAVTPITPETHAIEKLVDLIANSAAFQAEGGFASAEEAKVAIHYPFFRDFEHGVEVSLPFAVIEVPECGYRKIAGGSQNYLHPLGSIVLQLSGKASLPDAEDFRDSFFQFLNWSGSVIADIAANAAKDDSLAVVEIDREELPALAQTVGHQVETTFWTRSDIIVWDTIR